MSVKLLIYIIIGVIWVISRIMKKSGEPGGNEPGEIGPQKQPQTGKLESQSGKKQLTFEELLREISESKTVQKQAKPISKPAYVDYDDELEEEAEDLEKIPNNYKKDDKAYEVYEDAKRQAFQRPSLEETLKLTDNDNKFGRFKGFEIEEKKNLLQEYTRDFQDPEGLKKAFVMSEILNRRF